MEQTREALYSIPPDIGRELWVKIAMAIKSEYGDAGYTLFEDWSSGGDNYRNQDCRDTWRSIDADGGITVGTLYHLAREYGHVNSDPRFACERQRERIRNDPKCHHSKNELEKARVQQNVAERCRQLWDKARSASAEHAYLKRKAVKAYGIKQKGSDLLVPMFDEQEKLWNIERIKIGPETPKKGLKGGRRKGLYCPLRGAENMIVIAEGYATAASIHQATEYTVFISFGKSNLTAVAQIAKRKFPKARIIIAGDVGSESAAQIAAEAIDAQLAMPSLKTDGADFNDLHKQLGIDAVKQIIDEAYVVWPEIIPLRAELPPVPAFDFNLMPDPLQNWVTDICDRVQCAAEFVAVTVMVALASVIGRKACIYPKRHDEWFVVPNLWGVLIGRPSIMKTPAMQEGLRPLKRLAAAAQKAYKNEQVLYKADSVANELAEEISKTHLRKAMKSEKAIDIELAKGALADAQKAKSELPLERRYIINDATVEKIGELLNQNPNGLLLERDELNGWLRNLEREDRSNDRSFFLEAFNGTGTYTYDRIGRGTVHIESVTLSLIGCIQPSILRPYVWNAVNQGTGDDGLIQRLQLAVYPDELGAWKNVDRSPNKNAEAKAFELFERLDALPSLETNKEGRLQGIHFDQEGQEVFDRWRDSLEVKVRQPDIHAAIESHLVKYRSLMPSLALIINEVEVGHLQPVTRKSATKAVNWCQFLEAHAHRIYGAAVDPRAQNAIIISNRRNKLPDRFKAKDIQQKGWAGLSEYKHVKDALAELEEHGYIVVESDSKNRSGRPSITYRWNPRLQENVS